jgi:ribosomal protein S25
MGGTKKLRLSQLEKRQEKEKLKKEGGAKPKSERKTGEVLNEADEKVLEKLKGLKVLTPYVVFTQTGLRMGEAKRLLKRLEEKGLLRRVAEENRLPLYTLTQAA